MFELKYDGFPLASLTMAAHSDCQQCQPVRVLRVLRDFAGAPPNCPDSSHPKG
jgi:hypothetical protein